MVNDRDRIEAGARAIYFEAWKRVMATTAHESKHANLDIDEVWIMIDERQRDLCRSQARAAAAAFDAYDAEHCPKIDQLPRSTARDPMDDLDTYDGSAMR